MKTLFLLLFTCFLSAQPLLNETFSNYIKTGTTGEVVNYIFSPEWHTALGGENDSITEDLSTNGKNLRIQGWTNYAQLADSVTGSNILYSGGKGLKFNNANYYLDLANATGFPTGSPATWSIVVFARVDSATGAYMPMTWWGNSATNQTPYSSIDTGPNYLVSSGGAANELKSTATLSIPTDFYFVGIGNGTTESLFINGASAATPKTIVNTPNLTSFRIGKYTDAAPLTGRYTMYQIIIYSKALSQFEITNLAYMPTGWAAIGSDAQGVSRVNWGFYLGLTGADTVFYGTALTAGTWNISIDDSAASGVNYEILTSADASTWSTLASGTTGTTWGTKIYTGTGTGYIGIAVASGTAYFDNLTVTLQPATSKFKGYLTNDWWKSW